MGSLAKFFGFVWSGIQAAFSRITAVSAALASACAAIVAFFQTIITGISSIAESFQAIGGELAAKLAPMSAAIQGNSWFMIISYTGNFDGLFGVIGIITSSILAIFSVVVGLTIGFIILYAGFIVLSYVLRLLKGCTASFIDFN